jgi:hypothetical protein
VSSRFESIPALGFLKIHVTSAFDVFGTGERTLQNWNYILANSPLSDSLADTGVTFKRAVKRISSRAPYAQLISDVFSLAESRLHRCSFLDSFLRYRLHRP